MGVIDRTYRLTNEPGGLGFRCDASGASLAGVPLLRKTDAGFAVRPIDEVAKLIKSAYGTDADFADLPLSLGFISEALNCGNLAQAMVSAVLTRLPELDWLDASRLADAERRLTKYNPDQPRDWHGRWAEGGETDPAGTDANPNGFGSESSYADLASFLPDVDDALLPEEADGEAVSSDPGIVALERKYDDLDPVEFAKETILAGERLGRESANLTPAELEAAKAEYAFLQDRLTFWLGYDNKPPDAQANLLSAAQALYEGAVNGGIVPVGDKHFDLPQSMVAVAGGAAFLDNVQGGSFPRRPAIAPPLEEPVIPPPQVEPGSHLGDLIDNRDAQVIWGNKGNTKQGTTWEDHRETLEPDAERLNHWSEAFDQHIGETGEAISNKTLNTLSVTYIKRPREIFSKMKGYIDDAADYAGSNREVDLNLDEIKSKTLHVAVREYTSPEQWQYLYAGILYAKKRGVRVVITRIR